MDKSKRPTLKTIAEITGLAVTTVSRALSGAPEIALKTRQKVSSVADEIGYVPDRAAQRLRTGKTKVITLVLTPFPEALGFETSLIIGLTRAFKGTSYHLNITPCFDENDMLGPIRSIVRNKLADGVVINRTSEFDERVEYMFDQNFPFVCHGRTGFATPHTCVDFDNEAFAYEAVKRLAEVGCKEICMIPPATEIMYRKHIINGFLRAASEFGLKTLIPDNVTLDSEPAAIRQWARTLEESGESKPDGFVCAGESTYLAISSGIRELIPHEEFARRYHCVVKSTSGLLDQLSTPVDQIIEDIEESGERLGEAILEKILSPQKSQRQIILQPRYKFVDGK